MPAVPPLVCNFSGRITAPAVSPYLSGENAPGSCSRQNLRRFSASAALWWQAPAGTLPFVAYGFIIPVFPVLSMAFPAMRMGLRAGQRAQLWVLRTGIIFRFMGHYFQVFDRNQRPFSRKNAKFPLFYLYFPKIFSKIYRIRPYLSPSYTVKANMRAFTRHCDTLKRL